MFKWEQTVEEVEVNVENVWQDRAATATALGGVDFLMGNKTEWSEFIFDERLNIDEVGRMIGAVSVPEDLDLNDLENFRNYLADREQMLTEELKKAEDRLLRMLRTQRTDLKQWLTAKIDNCGDAEIVKSTLQSVLDVVVGKNGR